jgi:hypothetical protein
MADEWNTAAILRALWGCFFEVAFFWQLVRFPSHSRKYCGYRMLTKHVSEVICVVD